MSDHRDYRIGPTLAPTDRPWPITWEQHVDEECPHEWELVLLVPDGLHRTRLEEVVRCADCHVPRCGHSTEDDPCILRRHHHGSHVPASVVAVSVPPFDEDPIAIRFGWTSWQKNQAARDFSEPA